jgi:pimeloyl-ACP methyl ester carboxylesterase
MFSSQTVPCYPRRAILISIMVAFTLTNQWLFLSSPSLAHSLPAQHDHRRITLKQPDAQSLCQQKGVLMPQTSVKQPVIFVHGLNQNAHDMGKKAFVPIYSALQALSGQVQTFCYVDDQAYADGSDPKLSCPPRYTPCISQSAVLDNAIKLAGMISDLYQKTDQKVTLIGYSMGAAIIRTALAGCQQNVTCQAVLGPKIAEMVNNVFFLNGVQQGSWMLQSNKGKTIPAAISFLQAIKSPIAKILGLEVNAHAETDLAPQSINIASHNSLVPAKNIHYFNFYGDIKLSLKVPGIYPSTKQIDIGDGVLLPGTDNPQDIPFWGGARFCLQCEGQNFSQIDANTTYKQWPLTIEKSIDLVNLCTPISVIQHNCLLGSLFDILTNTPQFHTSIPSEASLDGTAIQVADTTGMSVSKTTSIANEIALQLQVMPPTQISCPAVGAARAAVAVPLDMGNHQNLVYTYNIGTFHSGTDNGAVSGILKRYDITTGTKTEIINLPHTSISQAQISTDGQWILFISQVSGNSAIQLIRMDGKGLQTLYCSQPSMQIATISWSPDKKLLAFNEEKAQDFLGVLSSIFILNTTNGTLQTEFIQPPNIENPPDPHEEHLNEYQIEGWLDNTRMYMSNVQAEFSVSPHRTDIFILNTTKGTNQTSQSLQRVTNLNVTNYGLDFSSSIDGTQLFVSVCDGCGQGGPLGPSSIMVFPATGGSPQTIFNNSEFAITAIRVISPTTILLNNENLDASDPNQNGVWKINTNGSGLTQLSSNGSDTFNLSFFQEAPSLCIGGGCMRSSWTNSSRDGHLFALLTDSITQRTQTIFIGSLNGGTTISIASASDDSAELDIVGWTTM